MRHFHGRGAIRLLPAYTLLFFAVLSPAFAGSTFSAERLVEAAREYLRQQAGPGADITYTGKVQDQTFSQSGVRARIREHTLGTGSYQSVIVEFSSDDTVIRQVSFPFSISRTISVPVAAADLPAGTILTAEHIRLEERSPQSVRVRDIPAVDDVIGRKLTENISASEILTPNRLTAPDGITRGQTVRLVVRTGTIVISTTAKALGDALPGEPVNVMRTGAKSIIQAVAVGDGIVEVQ